ncbi:hypothetical protein KI387_035759 [Taxus chinensis]|uniref:Cytochrome P450 n=1 Tax=Taxus chinensis TaxID=29808 RepID=A0AA38KJS6_TAXCH|nr:hypothetical protein KI387_035759 [Taxus chinensis]
MPQLNHQEPLRHKKRKLKDMGFFLFSVAEIIWLSFGYLVVFSVTKLAIAIWWKPLQIAKHFQTQGIAGPPYKLLYGNSRDLEKFMYEAASKPMKHSHDIVARVQHYYAHWSKIYGQTFLMWTGPTPVLVVGRSELCKEMLGDKGGIYGKRKWDPAFKELIGEGLVVLNGDKWAHHRRIINPSFHTDKLKEMVCCMVESTANMLETWEKAVKNGDKEVDVSQEFKALTSDIIARTAFGSSYVQGKHIFDLLAQQTSLAAQDVVKLLIPCYRNMRRITSKVKLRFLPFKRNIIRWRLHREIKNSLKQLIMSRKKDLADNHRCYGNDLLGSMMNTLQELKSTEDNRGLTMEEIIEECKTFFFAGQETTMNFLTFAIVLLAMHPEWQQRARAEILQVCGNDDPKFETVNKLKTLGIILNEVIRLYPPVAAALRETFKDTTLGGISIPAGTQVLLPVLSMNHDTCLWGQDANEFKPERFNEGVSKAAKDDSAIFIPFGYGLRSCVGQNYAMLESKLAIAMILQRFSFLLSPGYIHAPTSYVTMYAQHGAQIILHKL